MSLPPIGVCPCFRGTLRVPFFWLPQECFYLVSYYSREYFFLIPEMTLRHIVLIESEIAVSPLEKKIAKKEHPRPAGRATGLWSLMTSAAGLGCDGHTMHVHYGKG